MHQKGYYNHLHFAGQEIAQGHTVNNVAELSEQLCCLFVPRIL